MTPFRPSIEVLDARTLPSAVLAAPSGDLASAGETGSTVQVASDGVDFTNVGKVTFQDFHFTQTVNKASLR